MQQIIAESEAKGDRWQDLYRLLAFTDLRIGETLAFEWQHIDTLGKRVLVRQSTTMAADGLTLGPPKSENGNHAIPFDDAQVAALLDHREAQDAIREQAGAEYDDRGFVFPKVRVGQQGGLLASRQVERALKERTGRIPTPSATSSGRRCSRRGRRSCGSPGSWATPTSASPRASTSTPTRRRPGRNRPPDGAHGGSPMAPG